MLFLKHVHVLQSFPTDRLLFVSDRGRVKSNPGKILKKKIIQVGDFWNVFRLIIEYFRYTDVPLSFGSPAGGTLIFFCVKMMWTPLRTNVRLAMPLHAWTWSQPRKYQGNFVMFKVTCAFYV